MAGHIAALRGHDQQGALFANSVPSVVLSVKGHLLRPRPSRPSMKARAENAFGKRSVAMHSASEGRRQPTKLCGKGSG